MKIFWRNNLILLVILLILPSFVLAETTSSSVILKGRIADIADHPVEGAEVYVFDSKNVKRPADFISNRTDKDGLFRVQLPHGKYWLVAIARKGGAKFGPLKKDDRHSGEAVELSTSDKPEHYIDFTVLDLKEAARRSQKKNENLIKISGRILDNNGKPVQMAYAMANKSRNYGKMPFYLSTWTDRDGAYSLYVPRGGVYIGAGKKFPPESGGTLGKEISLENDTAGIDIDIVDR